MKEIQDWLGHSTFNTTADIYAHLDFGSKQASANAIANAFEPPVQESCDEPDMLPTNRSATLCGYTTSTLNRWAAEGRVSSVRYFGSLLYSKEGLAAFLSSPYGQSIAVPSTLHKELMADFCEEMQNSDMTFGVMSL